MSYPESRVGNIISILYSAGHPYLLRERTTNPKSFILIVEVYLHEYKDGEAIGRFPEQFLEIY
jgi:hypothetical protein